MEKMTLIAICALTVLNAGAAEHVRVIEGYVLAAEEGFLIGNGDLSASAYQNDRGIVLRLGKSDVWDRRLFVSEDAQKPWTNGEYVDFALGRKPFNPKAQKCAALGRSPYPCPKPTGEFTLRLPQDLGRPERFVQKLVIEKNMLLFRAEWKNGVVVDAEAVIPPGENVLAVRYEVRGWDEGTRIGATRNCDQAPVWATLERKADPVPHEWARQFDVDWRKDSMYRAWAHGKATSLPRPTATRGDGRAWIEQSFYPDPLFPEGFRYRMTLEARPSLRTPWVAGSEGHPDAVVHFLPLERQLSGELFVHVRTSRDGSLEAGRAKGFAEYAAATEADARNAFRTGLSVPDDAFLEDLWYATLHARRAICRRGGISPGLFFPSTLNDYSIWHGDWHSNYNLASIYYGDFTANQIDVADCYVDAAAMFLPIGRKIARDYYGCRGAMIPLQGFPALGEDDYDGTLTLGRMVYMTGWFAERHLEYWRYTRDDRWLAEKGYPFIRECALFYLDVLKKAPHPDLPTNAVAGAYHAFPSVSGEQGFRNDPSAFLDTGNVRNHVRGGLIAAIDASKILDVDADLRAQWEDRLDNLFQPKRPPKPDRPGDAYKRHCDRVGIRYFSAFPRPWAPVPEKWEPRKALPSDWYPGIQFGSWVGDVRDNRFVPGRDFAFWCDTLEKWTHANGLVWAMSIKLYGRCGAWTETLGCVAGFQEMLLQTWEGAIRLFPRWFKDRDVGFTRWRADGAFLVTADWKDGKVGRFEVESEKGLPCSVHGEWSVFDAAGNPVETYRDEFDRLTFRTVPGSTYRLRAR